MAKIEVIKQQDLKDCGVCSLACIINYYNGFVPLEKIRIDTCTNNYGTTAYHIIKAAQEYGFETLGIKAENIDDKNIYLPAIVHLVLKNGLQHFAVIYKITNNHVWLMDPAKGKVKLTKEEFLTIWDNVLILFTPISDIIKLDNKITLNSLILKLLTKNKNLFIKMCILSVFLMIISIISSFYFQIAINIIQNGKDSNFLKFIVLLYIYIYLLKVIIAFVKDYYLNYLEKNIDVEVFTNFLTHIFNLPLSFMQNRTTGEIISRIQELSEVKNLLLEIFTKYLLNIVLILGSIVVLYMINDKLFFILCFIIIIYIIIGLIFSSLTYKLARKNIDSITEFNSCLVENVDMNLSIKNLNLVDKFLYRLENKLILMLKNNFILQSFLNGIILLKNFVYEMGLFIITTFGIYLIYKNELEILTLITFNSIIVYLFDPIKELVDLIPKYNYLKASFIKISDFLNVIVENNNLGFNIEDKINIKFQNVSYSYNKYNNILTNINLEIEAGDKIFLNGLSGSGKSTLCNLLCLNLKDYSGIIELNGENEKDFNINSIKSNIIYVSQNEKIFTGSIRENIVCFRDVLDSDFLKIVKICRIDMIVDKRPNRYDTIINGTLNNLSGGEKQRIILARALLKKTQIIILDEALSEVNEELEKEIIENIITNFKMQTLIYVSHKNVGEKFNRIINMEDLNE